MSARIDVIAARTDENSPRTSSRNSANCVTTAVTWVSSAPTRSGKPRKSFSSNVTRSSSDLDSIGRRSSRTAQHCEERADDGSIVAEPSQALEFRHANSHHDHLLRLRVSAARGGIAVLGPAVPRAHERRQHPRKYAA